MKLDYTNLQDNARMRLHDYLDQCACGGAKLVEVVVMGPYPTCEFFIALRDWGKRSKQSVFFADTTLLADDGWGEESVSEIRALYKNSNAFTLHRVAVENGSGLVHAKVYYLKFRHPESRKVRRSLLVGSANASAQGFGVHAEAYVHISFADLDNEYQKKAAAYVRDLREGGIVCAASEIALGDSSWVRLPSVRFVEPDSSSNSFDAWLRRGTLCHIYLRESTFGCFSLGLKAAPPLTREADAFEAEGLLRDASDTLRHRYWDRDLVSDSRGSLVSVAPKHPSEGDVTQWKSSYFVETFYGLWTSEECLRKRQDEFYAKGRASRRTAIARIKKPVAGQYERWVDGYIQRLTRVTKRLSAAGSDASAFLDVGTDGKLDEEHYRARALAKLRQDAVRAKDSVFADRFERGVELQRVPQLGEEFGGFSRSWADTVMLRWHQAKAKLPSAIYDAVSGMAWDDPEDADKLLDLLRSRWDEVREDIVHFFEREALVPSHTRVRTRTNPSKLGRM